MARGTHRIAQAQERWLHGAHPGIYGSRAALPVLAALLNVGEGLASTEVLFLSERI